MNKPSFHQQIAEHEATIVTLKERVSIFEAVGYRKDAAHWRAVIASLESCIRACRRRLAAEVN